MFMQTVAALKRPSIALVAAGLIGAATEPALAQSNSTVVIGAQDIGLSLEPLAPNATSASGFRILDNVFDKLFTLNNDREIVPGLGLSAERTDDTTWVVSLREGVRFHDGTDFSAEDVAFTFGPERMLDEDAPGHQLGSILFPLIESVTVIDRLTVQFTTSAPDPVFIERFTGYGSGIVSKAAFEAAADFEAWAARPIGTGPFMIADVTENESVTLEAFEDYWDGPPNADIVRFQVVPELSARIAGLLAGDYDIITNVSPDQIDVIERNDGFKVVGGGTTGVRTLVYDTETNPILSDVRVRRAINFAIDRQLIADTIWGGRVEVPQCHQHPSFGELYDADRVIPQFDPERARALLAEAGYNGEEILFKSVGSFYTAELAETQAIAAMLGDVGLNIDIQIVENWSQVYAEPRGINNSSDSVFFADPLAGFVPRWAGTWVSRGFWKNEEFQSLSQSLASSLDPDARRDSFHRMLEIWCDEYAPGTVLHYLDSFFAINDRVDWEPTLTGLMDLRADALAVNAN